MTPTHLVRYLWGRGEATLARGLRLHSANGAPVRCSPLLALVAAVAAVTLVGAALPADAALVSPVWHWAAAASVAVLVVASVWLQGAVRGGSAQHYGASVSDIWLSVTGANLDFDDEGVQPPQLTVFSAGLTFSLIFATALLPAGSILSMAGMEMVAAVAFHVSAVNYVLAGMGVAAVGARNNHVIAERMAATFGGGHRAILAVRYGAVVTGATVVAVTIVTHVGADRGFWAPVAALLAPVGILWGLVVLSRRLTQTLHTGSFVTTVGDAMTDCVVTVHGDSTVQEVLSEMEIAANDDSNSNVVMHAAAVTDGDGRIAGIVWRAELAAIPQDERDIITAADVMGPAVIAERADALLAVLHDTPHDVLVTDSDDRIVGVVAARRPPPGALAA